MKRWFLTLGMLCSALDTQAVELGSSVDLNGTVSAIAWDSDAPLMNRRTGVGERLQLEMKARADDWVGFVRADVSAQSDLADQHGANRWREAWGRYQGGAFDLTMGRQLMPTGRTDVVILQDQFAPRDFTQMAMTESEQQLGLLGVRLDVYPSQAVSLTAALLRQDRGHVLPRSLSNRLPAGESLSDQPQSAGLLRAEYRVGALELAGTMTQGVNPFPGVSLGMGTPATVFPDETRLSLDGTLTFGKDVLRWDFVRASTKTVAMPGFGRERRSLAVGWDRGVWSDGTLSLQAIFRRHQFEQEEAAQNPALADVFEANKRLSQSFRASERYLVTTLKQSIRTEHQLELGILLGQNAEHGEQLRWIWRPTEGYVLRAKVQQTHGGEGTLLGNAGFKKLFFLEAGYQF
jgi:hypothetical protein